MSSDCRAICIVTVATLGVFTASFYTAMKLGDLLATLY